jgi:hypothetical protein
VLPFPVYALGNVLGVTPVPWLGWLDWLGWAQMTVVFWVVLHGLRARGPRLLVWHTLVALAVAGVAMGAYQRFVDPAWRPVGGPRAQYFLDRASGSFGIPNSFAGLLLLVLPAVGALALRRHASATQRVWWIWIGLVLLTGLALTLSRGAWLALGVVLPVWALLAAPGTWRRRAVWAAGVVLLVAASGAILFVQSAAVRTRFTQLIHDGGEVTRPHLWRVAWGLVRDAPVLGTGAGSYNVLFERHRPEGFRDEPQWAHNEYLNTLSDYGTLGFALWMGGMGAMAVGCWRAGRRSCRTGVGVETAAARAKTEGVGNQAAGVRGLADPLVVGGLGAGLAAFGLQMGLDFHLKIPALALAASTVAGLAVGAAWPVRAAAANRGSRVARGLTVLFAAVAIGAAGWFRPILAAEQSRELARRAVDRLQGSDLAQPAAVSVMRESRVALERATQRDAGNARAWADLAHVTLLLAHGRPVQTAELARRAEAAADRAVQVGPDFLEAWIRRGIARDLQGRRLEARADFVQALTLGPANVRAWFHYAFHLGRSPVDHELARAAVETCLRLDPWNSGALALRKQLAGVPPTP